MRSAVFALALGGCDLLLAHEGRSAGECSDAADNDGDGAFDCADDDCVGSPDCESSDADTDVDSDADTDTDTDDDGFDYVGTRHFGGRIRGNDCDDDIIDHGLRLTSGDEWSRLVERCPTCDGFYRNFADPSVVCTSYTLLSPEYRAVKIAGDQAEVYVIQAEGSTPGLQEGSDLHAAVSGVEVTYVYTFSVDGQYVTVPGTLVFDALPD